MREKFVNVWWHPQVLPMVHQINFTATEQSLKLGHLRDSNSASKPTPPPTHVSLLSQSQCLENENFMHHSYTLEKAASSGAVLVTWLQNHWRVLEILATGVHGKYYSWYFVHGTFSTPTLAWFMTFCKPSSWMCMGSWCEWESIYGNKRDAVSKTGKKGNFSLFMDEHGGNLER